MRKWNYSWPFKVKTNVLFRLDLSAPKHRFKKNNKKTAKRKWIGSTFTNGHIKTLLFLQQKCRYCGRPSWQFPLTNHFEISSETFFFSLVTLICYVVSYRVSGKMSGSTVELNCSSQGGSAESPVSSVRSLGSISLPAASTDNLTADTGKSVTTNHVQLRGFTPTGTCTENPKHCLLFIGVSCIAAPSHSTHQKMFRCKVMFSHLSLAFLILLWLGVFEISKVFKHVTWLAQWVAFVLGVSALNLGGSQTLVIAATSCAMLFEEIIMDSDNEGKKGFGYILQSTSFFFCLYASPLTVKAVIEDCTAQLPCRLPPRV